MENYSRARTVERPSVCPFPDLPPDTPHVRVKDGSKIRNLLPFALGRMGAGAGPAAEGAGLATEGAGPATEGAKPPLRQVVVTASGKGVAKAVTVAELLKRRLKGLHQLTRLLYVTVDDVWEPRSPDAGLESLTVSRSLPAVWILLSAEPLDPDQPGYQGPGGGAKAGGRSQRRKKAEPEEGRGGRGRGRHPKGPRAGPRRHMTSEVSQTSERGAL